MLQILRNLGLAFVAVFAMSVVVASAAQATSGTLTTTGNVTATLNQVGEHVITLTDHPVSGGFATGKCKSAHFKGDGTVATGSTSLTVTPTYSECIFAGLPALIFPEGCSYNFQTGTPIGTEWHVNTNIVCPETKAIRIVAQTCEVSVGSRSNRVTSSVANAAGGHLTLKTNIAGIHYTVLKDGIGCPLTGTGTFSQGDYIGTSTVRGLDAFSLPVALSIH